MICVLVLASAPQHPSALSHDVEEAAARAPWDGACGAALFLVVLLPAVATDAAALWADGHAAAVALTALPNIVFDGGHSAAWGRAGLTAKAQEAADVRWGINGRFR